jgi:tetratricopeptide (TPR) repeat protein
MILSTLERALPLALAASLSAASVAPPAADLERWLWNPRERTGEGIERLLRDDREGAVQALDTAARIAGQDPRTLLNAGAAHLIAGDPAGSLPLFERAVAIAPAPLAASAQYHLGTAHLAAATANPAARAQPSQSDPSAQSEDNIARAIAALEEALRLRPDFSDAKHNLELALRAQERQRQQRDKQQQERQREAQGSPPKEQQPSPNRRSADPSKPAEPPEKESAGRSESKPEEGRQADNQRGLEPGPQMKAPETNLTPEQVTRLLAAVENLERQQRRQQGAKKLSRAATVEKDW